MTLRAHDLPLHYNAVEILERNLTDRPDKPALFSRSRTLTFRQIAAEANRVGNALLSLAVRPGETVALLCLDLPEWVTVFFGTLKIGAISAGLNTQLTTADYDYILRDCRARVLVLHHSLLPLIRPLLADQPFLEHIVIVGGADPAGISYQNWLATASTDLAPSRTHREDFCTLNYSSGTTGQPKGILHAHKDLPLICDYWGKQTLGLRESDRTFAGAKLFFTYGTGGNLLFPFYVGASIVLFDGSPRKASNLLEMVAEFQPTIFYNAPTGYAIALADLDFEQRHDLSSVRLCVSGGENLPAPIWQAWLERTGIPIVNGVGCTEAYHNFISNRPDDIRPGASGKPVPGFEHRLVDPEGNAVADGVQGTLHIKSDTLALGYLHQYARSRQVFLGEWLNTGDQFVRDADGYYWHAGRSDDLLKVGGIWVSPMEVESTLISHPAVVECAVIGWHSGDGLIKPKAFVVLAAGQAPSADVAAQLIDHCRQQLAAYKRPRAIEFVAELPKTATGKIQRFKLRQSA
ncbi:MAG: benzoate-CoA ligase family protein [Anaerolineales bacterium]|nr:benzoate-CoA ligase family protein [Anaerolineales bacterium]